ncbi:holin family protein [Undibacterium umbellatum]|uniref:Holin family protein n=1 Tax=Undibacterium umbellatum TaxID=2762300 RepID=A0ABR6Z375_9BURK|nr:holin family protein [Undibacterium umbellatum]MBC3906198.1 holin family protein [Undibacterium umbellatum]
MALDPLSAVLDIGGKVIDRLWPDPAQAASAKLELIKLQQSGELAQIAGQMEINKVEAASSSTFVAGWRPFIGWVCGAAFAYKFVLAPIGAFVLAAVGHPIVMPVLDFTEMSSVLLGMLGLGGMRTLEKIKGAESNR